MRSLVSRSMTRVLAAPPADAEGDAPGEPLVPEVPAGPQAAARTSAMPKSIEGLGNPVAVGTKTQVLELFSATNDRPVLFREGRFFLLHAPGGIIAAYRKCTHLGCAVPWNDAEDRFHCPCHGSEYDKHTAVV